MFIALDSEGQRISIDDAVKGKLFFCEECGTPLLVCAKDSQCKRPYFAHKRRADCWYDYKNCMSDWHREWQEKFPVECREVVVKNEYGIKHRADIFINNTVIEFQHSPIAAEEIEKRNSFYISCGYNVVWVFDATNQIKNSVGNSIDPMKCKENDLCWKIAKRQFVTPMPSKVKVYLQYKTFTTHNPNQEIDLMIQLINNSPKSFSFLKTVLYIFQDNFLKEYGVISDKPIFSISNINVLTKFFIKEYGVLPADRELTEDELLMVFQRIRQLLQNEEKRNSTQKELHNVILIPVFYSVFNPRSHIPRRKPRL
ncbi:MAG: hypothetical protein J1F39_06765 [Clostridiales bacterium]|nr:hypothetical protein [Clostridiales bacterium]